MRHDTSLRLAAMALAISLSLSLPGCATVSGQAPGAMEVRQGVIEQITPTQLASTQHTGVGAVIGGLTGLGIGNLIGRGSGRDVAMVLGAIGGGLLGNQQQQRFDQPVWGQDVIVRTNSGVLISVVQPTNPELYSGERVYVEGSGQDARVVRAQ